MNILIPFSVYTAYSSIKPNNRAHSSAVAVCVKTTHNDEADNIIYVGKAVSLKNRVRQYFQSSRNKGVNGDISLARCIALMDMVIQAGPLLDRDILAVASDREDAVVQVFFIRGGRLIGRDHFYLKILEGEAYGEILSSFIKQSVPLLLL